MIMMKREKKMEINTSVRICSNGEKRYYGPAVVGRNYSVINEGIDWFLLKIGGKPVYIDKRACAFYKETLDEERDYFGPEDGNSRFANLLRGATGRST